MSGAPDNQTKDSVSLDEVAVLQCDPFAGDFGGSGSNDRILRDKMGTARKCGPCQDCGQEIKPGERIRIRAEIFDGAMMSFRWCQACCEAMAQWTAGNDEPLIARHALRQESPNV